MKAQPLIIVSAIVLIGLSHVSVMSFSREWERRGDRGVEAAISQVEYVFQSTGRYPAQIAVSRGEIWGMFKGPSIRFRSQNDGCAAYYHLWPLGPKKGMNCESGEWWFEE